MIYCHISTTSEKTKTICNTVSRVRIRLRSARQDLACSITYLVEGSARIDSGCRRILVNDLVKGFCLPLSRSGSHVRLSLLLGSSEPEDLSYGPEVLVDLPWIQPDFRPLPWHSLVLTASYATIVGDLDAMIPCCGDAARLAIRNLRMAGNFR